MKKRNVYCFVLIIIILVVVVNCIYFVRTANIRFGFNGVNYREIFDYPDSEWVCDNPRMELKVIDLRVTPLEGYCRVNTSVFALMHIETMGEEKEYVMTGSYGHVEIFDYNKEFKDGEIVDAYKIFHGYADYKKDFFSKEVKSFTIYKIIKDEIFDYSYENLEFYRVE